MDVPESLTRLRAPGNGSCGLVVEFPGRVLHANALQSYGSAVETPRAIGAVSFSLAEQGWPKLFFFLCLLSINLAVINVLPIPVLDGGHLFFLIVETIKGSPVSEGVACVILSI